MLTTLACILGEKKIGMWVSGGLRPPLSTDGNGLLRLGIEFHMFSRGWHYAGGGNREQIPPARQVGQAKLIVTVIQEEASAFVHNWPTIFGERLPPLFDHYVPSVWLFGRGYLSHNFTGLIRG